MNILMVHPHDIHSPVEPWTRRIKCLARELVKNGHQTRLVYFPLFYDQNQKPHFVDGYEVIPFSRYPSPIVFLRNILESIKLGKWADIIHFQKCHHYASIPAVITAYLNRKPLHYDWDDWEEKIWYESCGRGLHSRFIGLSFKILERCLPILADSLSCASQQLKTLSSKYGVKRESIFDTPVGADLDKFRPDLDGTQVRQKYGIEGELVLYIGQLHGAQYVDLFIQAANLVLHKRPDVRFMIVGEGFLELGLKRLVEDLGIGDKVIFTGSVPYDDVPSYIAASSVCVAPFRDTLVTRCKSPLKIVEYLSSGKAIVASNVGEVKRMVGGVGILVEPDNYHSLAEGILRLLNDKSLRENLGRFARQRAEKRYNWPNTASSLLEAYSKYKL